MNISLIQLETWAQGCPNRVGDTQRRSMFLVSPPPNRVQRLTYRAVSHTRDHGAVSVQIRNCCAGLISSTHVIRKVPWCRHLKAKRRPSDVPPLKLILMFWNCRVNVNAIHSLQPPRRWLVSSGIRLRPWYWVSTFFCLNCPFQFLFFVWLFIVIIVVVVFSRATTSTQRSFKPIVKRNLIPWSYVASWLCVFVFTAVSMIYLLAQR